MEIRFRRFRSFDDIEYKSVPSHAIKLKEASGPRELYERILVPTIILAVLLLLLSSKHYYDSGIMDSTLNPCIKMCATLGVFGIGCLVHEVIHAILFPHTSEVTIFIALKKGLLFCYSIESVKKARFILISITPSIILGVIPFVIWLIIPAEDTYYSVLLRNFSLAMILAGMGDYYNIKNVLVQVPQKALIQMKGWETYWYIQCEQTKE